MKNIFWNKLELVIFDVDGTLYNQKKLRRKMGLALISYYLVRPWRYRELLVLYHFRKEREKRHGYRALNLQDEQYLWVLPKVNVSLENVKLIIDKWIFDFPNKYLKECMYPGVKVFFNELQKLNILTAIFSDYESENKLKNMDICVDLIVCSTDMNINAFKPVPDGLNYILSALKIENKNNCLYIGDREELDGECSKLAGLPFLLLNKEKADVDFYIELSKRLDKD